MRPKNFYYLIILISAMFLQSCATVEQDIMVREVNVDDVLNSVQKNQKSVNTLKAMASVRIESIAEDSSFKQATIVKSPDIFRLEILAVFGKTIGVLISDGEKVYLRTSRDEMVFEDSERFNLSYFYPGIPREITTGVLADILLGRVPFGLWQDSYTIRMDEVTRLFDVSFENSIGTRTSLLVDPLKKRVEKAVVNLYNGRVVEIEYADFGFGEMGFFPKVVEISADKYLLKLSYVSSLDINSELDKKLFKP